MSAKLEIIANRLLGMLELDSGEHGGRVEVHQEVLPIVAENGDYTPILRYTFTVEFPLTVKEAETLYGIIGPS